MMHISSFTKFLTDVVNIDQTRLDELQVNVDAVFDALSSADAIEDFVSKYIPQGSWPHETIIKPLDDNEFDADFLIEFLKHDDWDDNPTSYLDELEEALQGHGTYKDMLDPDEHSRCIRVIYANQHHLDIVPYRVLDDGRKVIVNKDTNEWEDTDPEGFTTWIRETDKTANRYFRMVIRLLKYLRDYHEFFAEIPSIILTALAGAEVTAARKAGSPGYYSDVPTALFHIVRDLDVYLHATPTMPSIEDPSGACAPDGTPVTFDHRWDQPKYETLRSDIHELAASIEAAYAEVDSDKSTELWQAIFGDGFKAPEQAKKNSNRLIPGAAASSASLRKPQGG